MPPAIAYLTARYPCLSTTFVTREIDALRARGTQIETFSIRQPTAEDLLTEADRENAAATFTVIPAAPASLVAAHVRALRRSPVRYVRTLGRALRMSAGGVRNATWQLMYFGEAIYLWAELERRGLRHVHAHLANVAAGVALLTAHFGGTGWSWSFTMHGPTEFDDVSRYALADKVRSASFVACIGDYCRSQLMKLVEPEHWDKLSIVRCGVDVSRFALVERERDGDAPLSILCIGRLVPDKGQSVLLDALARMNGTQARLTLVGDGPSRADLERRTGQLGLSERVTFTGSVGQDQIPDLYADADVFCLPSFAEGIPVVLMEAMATGLPVVTTRIMGIPELVRDGESGVLVGPGRADVLAEALCALAGDAERRRAMGRAGRAHVEALFRIEDAADGMYRRLETLSS